MTRRHMLPEQLQGIVLFVRVRMWPDILKMYSIGVTWRGGKGANAPQYFFLPKNSF